MRHFKFIRLQDVTGTTGTGHVATGTVDSDGKTSVQWTCKAKLANGTLRKIDSVTLFNHWTDAMLLHGHDGKTVLVWDDTNEVVSDWDILNGKVA